MQTGAPGRQPCDMQNIELPLKGSRHCTAFCQLRQLSEQPFYDFSLLIRPALWKSLERCSDLLAR